ncbi:penicillin-binding protein [Streptomyces sp. NBC_01381]|uniref:transglycosylase domain-containing protein n=1 Tax=Streptomyces sp. NBC_01381 TaxID=2903845 RepID=UPI0022566145|nr:transglycosylase domain-containing protein [Streptomyces sp. NBC_01381]MCX4670650.1 penicillin-binding protein [Streptomyces sp. NBC_01381]
MRIRQAEREPRDAEEAEEAKEAEEAAGETAVGRRRRHATVRPKSRLRRIFSWKRILTAALSFILLVVGGFTALYLAIDVPQGNAQAKAESNVYLYSDGTLLARTGDVNRESVPINRVSKPVRHAFVAAENKSFYEDSGIDPAGLTRGLLSTVSGEGTQGGSTITQQYVKNYYLSQEQTLTRKAKEMVISLKVDRRESKDDILAGYLNTSYFGRVAYGIQAAARAYYDTDVSDLTVEQGAYLAALLQAPSQYDWAVAGPTARQLVKARWNYVLDNMVGQGWLDKAERKGMRFPVPREPRPTPGLDGQAGYLVDVANRELAATGISEQQLAAGGWTITLNIDRKRQRALRTAVDAGVSGPGSQSGAVSVDPRDGRIVAMYGGRDYTKHYLNNATRSDYQTGPAFLPVVNAAKMEDLETARPDAPGEHASAGIEKTSVDLGIDPHAGDFDDPEAVSLGLLGTSPLELAEVYATLAHHGKKVTPSIVKSAQRGDERADVRSPLGGQTVSRTTADTVTADLRTDFDGQLAQGPDSNATVMQPVAGVSGASDDRKAAWHIGFTPQLLTVVGLFGENPKSGKQARLTADGEKRAGQIWTDYMSQALRGERSSGRHVERSGRGETATQCVASSGTPVCSTPSSSR